MLVVELFFIAVCVISFVFCVKRMIKSHKSFEQKRSEFINYLYTVGDNEGLKVIGEINWFGKVERWYPNQLRVKSWLKKRSEETQDEKYKDYFEYLSKSLTRSFLTGFFAYAFLGDWCCSD